MFPPKTTDMVSYICESPYNVMSSVTRAYHKLYRQYIYCCKKETFNINLNITDDALMIKKRYLSSKLFKLKKYIPVKKERIKARLSDNFITYKRKLFLTRINSF